MCICCIHRYIKPVSGFHINFIYVYIDIFIIYIHDSIHMIYVCTTCLCVLNMYISIYVYIHRDINKFRQYKPMYGSEVWNRGMEGVRSRTLFRTLKFPHGKMFQKKLEIEAATPPL